jgi:hypothetical protein
VKKGNGTIRKFISKKEMVPLGNSKMKSLMVKNRAKISDDERNKKEKKWSWENLIKSQDLAEKNLKKA